MTQICKVTGKVSYSRVEAGQIVNGCRKHNTASHIYRGSSIPKRIYKCEYCGRYHTTHYKYEREKGFHKEPLKIVYGKGYSGEYEDDLMPDIVAWQLLGFKPLGMLYN